ncbi:MAG: TetR/AcrR family transcriptional regulator [Thermoleophilaceae bacterium]
MSRSQFEIEGRRSDSARAKGRVTLTRADVVNAGARLLDSEGVEGISMRKLAKALDTGAATLYWHVQDKDELLLAILDDTLGDVSFPEDGGWDERLTKAMISCHDALLPRPALIDVLWGAAWELGPETLRIADELIGLVAETGLPEDEVADAYFALITLLFGFVAGEGSSPGNPSYSEIKAQAGSDNDQPAEASEKYPNLVRYGPGATHEAMERRFRYALERFIEGIRARVDEQAKAPAGKPRRRGAKRKAAA